MSIKQGFAFPRDEQNNAPSSGNAGSMESAYQPYSGERNPHYRPPQPSPYQEPDVTPPYGRTNVQRPHDGSEDNAFANQQKDIQTYRRTSALVSGVDFDMPSEVTSAGRPVGHSGPHRFATFGELPAVDGTGVDVAGANAFATRGRIPDDTNLQGGGIETGR